ncbi:MAG: helix-turn-helix transcriptional regulator [Anaerolineae bacterium]|nr:helix-turn-helix transcriptional regulator [Anaerolineae bacterium]
MQTETTYEEFLQFCKGLANANRQHILFAVFVDKQEHTVGEIAEKVGIANSTASEHLSILKSAGILQSEKRDREVYYMVNKDKIREYIILIEVWLTCC